VRGERGAAGRAAVRCALGAVAGAVAMGTPCVSQASVNKHAFVVVFKHFFLKKFLREMVKGKQNNMDYNVNSRLVQPPLNANGLLLEFGRRPAAMQAGVGINDQLKSSKGTR